jgi:hypothetical protein
MRVTHEESNHDDSLCFSFVFSYTCIVVVVVSFYISLYTCASLLFVLLFFFSLEHTDRRERETLV